MAILPVGLFNVTAGSAAIQGDSVTLGFDARIVELTGSAVEDVRTYATNDGSDWTELELLIANHQNSTIRSRLDGLDVGLPIVFVNAVKGQKRKLMDMDKTGPALGSVAVPHHEQVWDGDKGTSPTTHGDPHSEITLIHRPAANPRGSANLAFPLRLPIGRNGLNPMLSLQYHSEAGNSWLGQDWDLKHPSIAIDTRWGAPRFTAAVESETYLFGGEQLAPVHHRGTQEARTTPKRFWMRVESSFSKIIREGSSPSTYWFTVTHQTGVTDYYGGTPEGGVDSASVLLSATGEVYYWALKETRDLHGNFVRYHMDKPAIAAGQQLYLQKITYTGSGTTEGPYAVTMTRSSTRKDVRSNCRTGACTATGDLLTNIALTFNGASIRGWTLKYTTGRFDKSLLESITELGADGSEFHTHTFEYYDDVALAGGGYSAPQSWAIGSDGISAGTFTGGEASAIGTTKGSSFGVHLYTGFNLEKPGKDESIGFKVGTTTHHSEGLVSIIDINGDNLPDKVYKRGGCFYRPNLAGNTDNPQFGDPIPINGLSEFIKDDGSSFSAGVELYEGVNFHDNWSRDVSTTTAYWADVNGDGLMDVVNNGQVLFNHLNAAGEATFTADSSDTPNPIGPAQVAQTAVIDELSQFLNSVNASDQLPLVDTLSRWVAPWAGTVAISGVVAVVDIEGALLSSPARVAIQHNDLEIWSAVVDLTTTPTVTPTGVGSVTVAKGDRLFFRVGAVSSSEGAGAANTVQWDPEVKYNQPSTLDANNLDVYDYIHSEDFALIGRQDMFSVAPVDGYMQLSGWLNKTKITSDTLILGVVLNDASTFAFSTTIAHSWVGAREVMTNVTVKQGDKVQLVLRVESNIDYNAIRWAPQVSYNSGAASSLSLAHPFALDVYPVSGLTAPLASSPAPAAVYDALYTISFSAPVPTTTTVVVTAKSAGVLLRKTSILCAAGSSGPFTVTLPISIATTGEAVFYEAFIRDGAIRQTVSSLAVTVNAVAVPSAVYGPIPKDTIFGQEYRGWSHLGYNGEEGRSEAAVDESLLELGDNYSPLTSKAFLFFPQLSLQRWQGPDGSTWVSANQAGSGRMGSSGGAVFDPSDVAGFGGGQAVNKVGTTDQNAIGGGAMFFGFSHSSGGTKCLLDFMDLNGDKYPDVVQDGGAVQFSPPVGGLMGAVGVMAGLGSIRNEHTEADSLSISGSPAHFHGKGRGTTALVNGALSAGWSWAMSQLPNIGLPSPNTNTGDSHTTADLRDINGDGLPDKLSEGGGATLNVGYSMGPTWPGGVSKITDSNSVGTGADLGFNDGLFGFAGGVSVTSDESTVDDTMLDINGDGLLDMVSGSNVAFNQGSSWGPSVPYTPGTIQSSPGVTEGAGIYYTISIGPLCTVGCYIIINPGADVSQSAHKQKQSFTDVNGDGYVDYLTSNSDGDLQVSLSTIARTNLLKKVNRPLGGSFELDYTRTGNTYENPKSRYSLSKVALDDGVPDDGPSMLTTYTYGDGFESRYEREFYGFRQVVEEQRDTGNNDAVYRSIVRRYSNDKYHTRTHQVFEAVAEGAAGTWLEGFDIGLGLSAVVTDSALPAIEGHGNQPAAVEAESSTVAVGVVEPSIPMFLFIANKTSWWDNRAKTTFSSFTYNENGQVLTAFDGGDQEDTADDRQTTFAYSTDAACVANHVIQHPVASEVYQGSGASAVLLGKAQATIDCTKGHVTQIEQFLADGTSSITNMTYTASGNVASITGPPNLNAERSTTTYTYDSDVDTHIASITDAFGTRSTVVNDPLFGKVLSKTSVNKHTVSFTYDAFGRLWTMTSAKDQSKSGPTVIHEYHHDAAVPWALVSHGDHYKNGTVTNLQTVTFVDGMGRVIQTKTDYSLFSGETTLPTDVMVVSGRKVFDHSARVVKEHFLMTEPRGHQGVFSTTFDSRPATLHEFDVLDRPTKTTHPDGTTLGWSYSLAPDAAGVLQVKTQTTDQLGRHKQQFINSRGKETTFVEFHNGSPIATLYVFDALTRVVRVTDALGKTTTVEYDLQGRRTAIESCDAGRTEYVYDLAGNKIATSTSALRAEDPTKAILFNYDHHRKISITYPNYPANNVAFVWGTNETKFQEHNQVGRVMFISDESGAVIYEFDEIGQRSREIKTVATHSKPATYVTEYAYDAFGRIRHLTYPDDEVLTHDYDGGGHLYALHGEKNGKVVSYVTRKEYTEFGQVAYVLFGNLVTTRLTYQALMPGIIDHRVTVSPDPDYQTIQDMQYTYDAAKNPTALANPIIPPKHAQYGGPSWYTFEYDDLDRMVYSTGKFDNTTLKEMTYFVNMSYNHQHSITEKNQRAFVNSGGGKPLPDAKLTYDWDYAYDGAKAPTGPRPAHGPWQVGNTTFTYDANGNTLLEDDDLSGKRVSFEYDENNVCQVMLDGGSTVEFNYDYTGQRVIKRGPQGEIAYVNRHFTIRNGVTVEKHFFAGDMRVSSHLINHAFNSTTPDKDLALYYYHYDHLKSAHWVTGDDGDVFQHLEYFPSGETWMEEGSPTQRIPFNWIDEELDTTTGFYYLHQRYYDPRTSLFVNPDPALSAFLKGKGKGGIFDPRNLNLYTYGFNSPLRYNDKSGLAPQEDKELVVLNNVMYSTYENPTKENVQHTLQQQANNFPALRPELSRLKVLSASKNSEVFMDPETKQGFAVARGTQPAHWNTGPADLYQDAKIAAGFNPGSRDAEFAATLDAQKKAHPEVTHWTVTGHSLGGRVAEDYAENHPDTQATVYNAARPGLSWGLKGGQKNMKEYHTKWDFISWGNGPAAERINVGTNKLWKHPLDYYTEDMEGKGPKSGAVTF